VAEDAEKARKERRVTTVEGRPLGHEEPDERLSHSEPNGFHALFLQIEDANIQLERQDGGVAQSIVTGFSSGQDDGLLDALIRLSFSIGYISHLASQPANSK